MPPNNTPLGKVGTEPPPRFGTAQIVAITQRMFAQRIFSGSGDEREFLPAALEIIETPASPASRLIAGLIVLFLFIAIAWATFGHVDIIATAPGKIIPTGRSKVIQPLEIGVVRAVHVQDGQAVKAGDVLVELDPTTTEADRDRLASDLATAKLDAARLRASLDPGADPTSDPLAKFDPPQEAPAAQIETAKQFVINQVGEYRAKLAALDRQRTQNEANRSAVAAMVEKLSVAIPLLQQQADARKYLYDKQVGSKLTWLQVEQDLEEHQQELKVQQGRLKEAEATLAGTIQQRLEAEGEYHRTLLDSLTQAEQKSRDLAQQLIQAEQRMNQQTLTAPVDGVVQQIAIHTVGGVVTPAEALMVIVPADSHLEIEAMVSNRDIGFVHEGEAAEIKVDTFNFTRYGLLHGKVLNVSEDAIIRDKPSSNNNGSNEGDGSGSGAPSGSGDAGTGQDLIYSARVSLDKTQMAVEDRMVNLAPGMAVTVEIKTGRRRVIDYLLSPLTRYKQEALRER